jgi:hypothetical protein
MAANFESSDRAGIATEIIKIHQHYKKFLPARSFSGMILNFSALPQGIEILYKISIASLEK